MREGSTGQQTRRGSTEFRAKAIREDSLEEVMSEQSLKRWGGAGPGEGRSWFRREEKLAQARGDAKNAMQAKAAGVLNFP